MVTRVETAATPRILGKRWANLQTLETRFALVRLGSFDKIRAEKFPEDVSPCACMCCGRRQARRFIFPGDLSEIYRAYQRGHTGNDRARCLQIFPATDLSGNLSRRPICYPQDQPLET